MQLHAAIFYAAQTASSVYALRKGGEPERCVATALVVAAIVSASLPFDPARSFHIVDSKLVLVDITLLTVLIGVALWSSRYWPMWLAAMQLDAVALHGVRAYDAKVWALVYAQLTGLASYPMMILLVVGTIRHHHRVLVSGPELGWVGRPYDGAATKTKSRS